MVLSISMGTRRNSHTLFNVYGTPTMFLEFCAFPKGKLCSFAFRFIWEYSNDAWMPKLAQNTSRPKQVHLEHPLNAPLKSQWVRSLLSKFRYFSVEVELHISANKLPKQLASSHHTSVFIYHFLEVRIYPNLFEFVKILDRE